MNFIVQKASPALSGRTGSEENHAGGPELGMTVVRMHQGAVSPPQQHLAAPFGFEMA